MEIKAKQRVRLHEWFLAGMTITEATAKDMLAIGKLSARISEMRRMGYPISDKWERGKNKYGDPIRYKRYYYEADAINSYRKD